MYPRQDPSLPTLRCPYKVGDTTQKDPHNHIPFNYERPLIFNNILDVVGNTPMVRLNKIPQSEGVKCEFFAKCEFLNPGGSLKDRIGVRMLHEAELSKRCKAGDTLIEATSGNTGIGLALSAAVKGYNIHITLPEKMSTEKTDVLQALGAIIHRTPTEAAFDDPESHISKAINLNKELPNSHILDQYINAGNTLAHYDGTGSEIVHQMSGQADYLFVGAGTGGTISGIGRKVKESMPNCKVIGVDPHGSILAMPQSLNGREDSYLMEGIGYDFVPRVLDRSVVDDWIKIDDTMALPMTRRIIREEGMFCGGSSGGVLSAAIQYCKQHNLEGKKVVVMFADNLRNYITKLVQKEWMADKGFIPPTDLVPKDHALFDKPLEDLNLSQVDYFTKNSTVGEVIDVILGKGVIGAPIVDETTNKVIAVAWEQKIMEGLITKKLSRSDKIIKIWNKDYSAHKWTELNQGVLHQLLTRRPVVYIEKIHEGKLSVYQAVPRDLIRSITKDQQ